VFQVGEQFDAEFDRVSRLGHNHRFDPEQPKRYHKAFVDCYRPIW
jgi:hypothetical protein